MACDRCDSTGRLGLTSLSMPCPDCTPENTVMNDIERTVGNPVGFARLCAFIGYTDEQCVTTLVSETALTAEEAARIVEDEYSRYARREAEDAVREFEAMSDSGSTSEGGGN